jgi:hypothetical protein
VNRRTTSLVALFTLGLGVVAACSAGTAGEDGVGASGSGASGAGSPTSSGEGGGFAGGSPGVGGFESCATAEDTALPQKAPADIIIAVDTSGSMSEEAGWVQDALNGFATTITAAGIDLRVVLIADATVCIPAPLGSGQCNGADTSAPVYRHVVQTVASTDALQQILATYPQYSDMLRTGATKTFLVVSDDESDMSAGDFTNQLLALSADFQGFQFDSIVASAGTLSCGPFGTCPTNNVCCYQDGPFCMSYGEEPGDVYMQLSQQTGGVIGDLCAQEFGPIFDDMAEGVIVSSQLACDYAIPTPPEGEVLNPAKVNVTYLPGGGGEPVQLYNVPGGLADCGPQGGWYYDDPVAPTRILVCPSTCTTLQADTQGEVKVVFGCDTVIVPQ